MAKRNYKKEYRQAKTAAKKLKKAPTWVIVVAIILVIAIVAGYFLYTKYLKKEEFIPAVGDVSFHFMTLGNKYNGDCVYIKAGDVDILIDAGSEGDSVDDIKDYVDNYIDDDNVLEYVIITHADSDHINGFAETSTGSTIFDYYDCETIIEFANCEKTYGEDSLYTDYVDERNAEVNNGAKCYTALECYNNSKPGAQREYQLTESVKMEILYNYYYDHETDDENNNSVCVMFHHGSRKFLFTGDLLESGEKRLVANNDLGKVELYKAGHHGSKTSSTDELLSVIQPKIVVIPCSVGYNQFRANPENIFPSVAALTNIAEYTSKVYAPTIGDEDYTGGAEYKDLNGDIVVTSDKNEVKVICSNNDTLLKDTEWMKNNDLRKNIVWERNYDKRF